MTEYKVAGRDRNEVKITANEKTYERNISHAKKIPNLALKGYIIPKGLHNEADIKTKEGMWQH